MKPLGSVIVKVGGSLFDLPDLRLRLRRWLDGLSTRNVVLVPGGGALADAVRELDRCHGLGEEQAHWLALQTLRTTAHFLAALVPGVAVVTHLDAITDAWAKGTVPVLDLEAFARQDEESLPHRWDVTSDSLAARVAVVTEARELILLKSVSLPEGMGWSEAGQRGLVDPYFARAAEAPLKVRFVNFRALD
jgi:aspartokinase-like uncharacterized kinase